ncbi:hypothetical protein ACSL103130_12570 [Actinomyces slackii]|uniref:Uncharacterized protein n=1 Tax=Actinomyces slackii TaxID=52774 RepID=A0A3S4SDQ7_9ACTO|nr:Uncharacterised protein [Actinomyces slackii]
MIDPKNICTDSPVFTVYHTNTKVSKVIRVFIIAFTVYTVDILDEIISIERENSLKTNLSIALQAFINPSGRLQLGEIAQNQFVS